MTNDQDRAQGAARLRRWVLRALGASALTACGLAGGVGLASSASALGGVDDLLGDATGTVKGAVTQVVDTVAEPAAKPAPETKSTMAAAAKPVADVAKPVAEAVEPVEEAVKPLADVTKPVAEAVKPVVEAARPVTDVVGGVAAPVVKALEPVTRPVLHTAGDALVPVLDPILRPVGAAPAPVIDPFVPIVTDVELDVPTPPGLAGLTGDDGILTGGGVFAGGFVGLLGPTTTAVDMAAFVLAAEGSAFRFLATAIVRAVVGTVDLVRPTSGGVLTLALGGGELPSGTGGAGAGAGGSPLRSAEIAVLAFLALVVLRSWMLASADTRTAHPRTFHEVPVAPA
ncbi:hypothetical protein ACFT2C_08755 [Promicromonospora sp. NPDC057138]|uniref:hypothetical protein n=1 Tax=Promicromonospora sp. NPDC057138 TaxID=3346031 RepID=UPI003641DEC3